MPPRHRRLRTPQPGTGGIGITGRFGTRTSSLRTQALADTYAEVYQLPAQRMLPAVGARAAAMDLSDQWIREGKDPNSPLLEQIATLLVRSYRSLSEAVAATS